MNKEIGDKAYKKANQMLDRGDITFSDFSIDELKCLLITCDGMGKNIKVKALEEIIDRLDSSIRCAIQGDIT